MLLQQLLDVRLVRFVAGDDAARLLLQLGLRQVHCYLTDLNTIK